MTKNISLFQNKFSPESMFFTRFHLNFGVYGFYDKESLNS